MLYSLFFPLTRYLPMTRIKLVVATLIYVILRCSMISNRVTVTRNGVRYHLNLSEGIDLAVFVFRTFQSHITRMDQFRLPENAVILDVGANMGSMSLAFARSFPGSTVYAFEPTRYGFNRLSDNLRLNPDLSLRIHPYQSFVSNSSATSHNLTAAASWKINRIQFDRHPLHGGIRTFSDAPCITIDDFCNHQTIEAVHLIKIDTDGHELSVILGAMNTIRNQKPVIVFEAGRYIMKEHNIRFRDYAELLEREGYSLFSLQHNKRITIENAGRLLPLRSTIDIIGIHANTAC